MDSQSSLLMLIVGGVISIVMLYLVIEAAVRSAHKDSLKQQEFTNKMLLELLKEKGVTTERISEMINEVFYGKKK